MNIRLSTVPVRMLTIVAVAMIAVLLLASAVLAGGGETTSTEYAGPTVSYQVQHGDSLWSIAAAHDANRDRRGLIDEIVALNGIERSLISAGQILYLPAE